MQISSQQPSIETLTPTAGLSFDLFEAEQLEEDSELLAIFVETGSRSAVEKLIQRYGPMVAGVIRRILSNPHDGEDAFQATFLILLKSAKKIRSHASIAAWLYGVAYRTACRVRQNFLKHRGDAMNSVTTEAIEFEDPLEKIAKESEIELLDRELNRLPAHLKEILIEHHFLGHTAPRIAERLNLSLSAVEGRLRRGRATLRRQLARRGISFSLAVAVAATYQKQTVAAVAESWTQSLLQSDLVTQTITTGMPPSDSTLQSLIQGELSMKTVIAKWAAAAAIVVGTSSTIGMISLINANDGGGERSIVVSAPAADQTAENPVVELKKSAGSSGSSMSSTSGGVGTAEVMGKSSGNKLKVVPFVKPTGPLPNWMTEGGTIAQEEAAAREEIRKTMRKRVTLDFNNTPLRNVLEQFAVECQVGILIDTAALEAGGVTSPEDPVTLAGLGPMSMQRALKLILDPKECTYKIEPEFILVTTKDSGGTRTTRYYDLAHFLPSNEYVPGVVHAIQQTVQANWEVDGGEDKIVEYGSILIVQCDEEGHLAIEGMLQHLSKLDNSNLVPFVPPPTAPGMGGMF